MPCCLASPIWSGLEDTPFMMRPPRRISAVRGMLFACRCSCVCPCHPKQPDCGWLDCSVTERFSSATSRCQYGDGPRPGAKCRFLLERRKSAPLPARTVNGLANLPAIAGERQGCSNGRAFRKEKLTVGDVLVGEVWLCFGPIQHGMDGLPGGRMLRPRPHGQPPLCLAPLPPDVPQEPGERELPDQREFCGRDLLFCILHLGDHPFHVGLARA